MALPTPQPSIQNIVQMEHAPVATDGNITRDTTLASNVAINQPLVSKTEKDLTTNLSRPAAATLSHSKNDEMIQRNDTKEVIKPST